MQNYDVFISYRRIDGVYPALLLFRDLVDSGYDVFFDFDSIRSGEFPQAIEEGIKNCIDFIMLVTKEAFSERIFDENDWMRQEIELAIKHKKNIIPIFIDAVFPDHLPKALADIVKYQGVSQVNPNLIKETYDQLKNKYFRSSGKRVVNNVQRMERRKSIYNPNYGNEFDRLKVQANNALLSDMTIINSLTQTYDQLKVLDLGCAYGFVTESRFKDDKFSRVIGVDISEPCIAYANEHKSQDKFQYYQIDLESPDLTERLEQILKENQIEQFDVIYSSLVLHHLKSPEDTLRKIRRVLKNDGYIILRGSDDGSKTAYEDFGLLKEIIDRTLKVKGVSDRLNGRKLYKWLSDTNYQDVKIQTFLRDTSNVSYDDRELIFRESFSYRINYFRKQWENNPQDERLYQDFNKMEEMLAEFQTMFYKKDFWFGEFDYIAYAKK